MSIGNNIRNIRLEHGLSQKELAMIAGVTDKAVSAWETDKILPRMGVIQKMADYFGIKKSDIIEPIEVELLADTERIVKNSKTRILNEQQNELVNGYDELNDTGKLLLFGILDSLRQSHSKAVCQLWKKRAK